MKAKRLRGQVRVYRPYAFQYLTRKSTATRRSPRKGEKRAIYVLNLALSRRMVDSTLEPSKKSVYLSVSSHSRRNNPLLKVNSRTWKPFIPH